MSLNSQSSTACPVSVIVLTYNEEANIAACLESLRGFSEDVFIVDSFSTDGTLEIAQKYNAKLYQNPWQDWATQRNWALDHLNPAHDWVFFLDADERVTPEFATELQHQLAAATPELSGLNVHFRFFFLNRPLKFAYESPPVMRLIRRGRGRWQGKGAREYASITGQVLTIKNKLDHWDQKGLDAWIAKQTDNALREVRLHTLAAASDSRRQSTKGPGTSERPWRRWLRAHIYESLPRLWRAFPYFIYRLIIRGGILDGRAGFAYCFLQGLWYPLLIDMMLEEKNV